MKAATAIKKFIGTPGNNPNMTYLPASVTEIKEFKDSCSEDEWRKMGKDACDALGENFED